MKCCNDNVYSFQEVVIREGRAVQWHGPGIDRLAAGARRFYPKLAWGAEGCSSRQGGAGLQCGLETAASLQSSALGMALGNRSLSS